MIQINGFTIKGLRDCRLNCLIDDVRLSAANRKSEIFKFNLQSLIPSIPQS